MQTPRFAPPLLLATALLGLGAAARAQQPSQEMAQVVAAYAAKITASARFVSNRTMASVRAQELQPATALEKLVMPLLKVEVDEETRQVTCKVGAASATAIYREGLGCVLLHEQVDIEDLQAMRPANIAMPSAEQAWPLGEQLDDSSRAKTGIASDQVQAALDRAFAEAHDNRSVHTRAIVVLHKGELVAERYAEGFDRDMPLPGWSMSKTLTAALCGLRAGDGEFDADSQPRVPGWGGGPRSARRGRPDPRGRIRNGHLLTMTAGLRWNESYEDPNSDVLRMLFASADHAAAYARQPSATPPGDRFAYASGATNLLCRVLRSGYDEDEEYWALPHRLFAALGMRTATLETDPIGTFVGSSYGYASARDWARLGMLYCNGGTFAGQRILSEEWLQSSTTPHDASNGQYGYQLWLNRDPDGKDGEAQPSWPELPEDLMRMDGHEGQYVVMSPAAELVIVRLGCTKQGGFDIRGLVRDIHTAAGVQTAKELVPAGGGR
ncbi:MAG: serine hydrolase domain-containing protein [Planctomycetota bacterium]